MCDCKKKKSQIRDRAKYGVSRCDAFSFHHSVGHILSNALFQYVADGKQAIMRDDWDIIEKHAKAIKDFADADSWDKRTTSDWGGKSAMTIMFEYEEKEQAWREAMFWLTENWKGLWW